VTFHLDSLWITNSKLRLPACVYTEAVEPGVRTPQGSTETPGWHFYAGVKQNVCNLDKKSSVHKTGFIY